eukprot:TRINITY_DN8297_c0_g1_i3.p1 TRINITY_DN8297_c0_g1~~TRINITY_DN8297_c0_g1_i3.p1  ORF type:complete len:797 (-),score=158.64 TRINITY_DN8297_c0_g1_i3:69-2459(-)
MSSEPFDYDKYRKLAAALETQGNIIEQALHPNTSAVDLPLDYNLRYASTDAPIDNDPDRMKWVIDKSISSMLERKKTKHAAFLDRGLHHPRLHTSERQDATRKAQETPKPKTMASNSGGLSSQPVRNQNQSKINTGRHPQPQPVAPRPIQVIVPERGYPYVGFVPKYAVGYSKNFAPVKSSYMPAHMKFINPTVRYETQQTPNVPETSKEETPQVKKSDRYKETKDTPHTQPKKQLSRFESKEINTEGLPPVNTHFVEKVTVKDAMVSPVVNKVYDEAISPRSMPNLIDQNTMTSEDRSTMTKQVAEKAVEATIDNQDLDQPGLIFITPDHQTSAQTQTYPEPRMVYQRDTYLEEAVARPFSREQQNDILDSQLRHMESRMMSYISDSILAKMLADMASSNHVREAPERSESLPGLEIPAMQPFIDAGVPVDDQLLSVLARDVLAEEIRKAISDQKLKAKPQPVESQPQVQTQIPREYATTSIQTTPPMSPKASPESQTKMKKNPDKKFFNPFQFADSGCFSANPPQPQVHAPKSTPPKVKIVYREIPVPNPTPPPQPQPVQQPPAPQITYITYPPAMRTEDQTQVPSHPLVPPLSLPKQSTDQVNRPPTPQPQPQAQGNANASTHRTPSSGETRSSRRSLVGANMSPDDVYSPSVRSTRTPSSRGNLDRPEYDEDSKTPNSSLDLSSIRTPSPKPQRLIVREMDQQTSPVPVILPQPTVIVYRETSLQTDEMDDLSVEHFEEPQAPQPAVTIADSSTDESSLATDSHELSFGEVDATWMSGMLREINHASPSVIF